MTPISPVSSPNSPKFQDFQDSLTKDYGLNFKQVLETLEDSAFTKQECFELAKSSIEEAAWDVAVHIKKFQLTPEQRFEIAKSCARKHSEGTARFVGNFDLNSSQRLEIASICAEENGSAVAQNMPSFDLEKIHHLKIAKKCAKQNGAGTARYIQNFRLEEAERFEVFQYCAEQNGLGSALHFKKFKLSKAFYFKAAHSCIQQNPRAVQSLESFSLSGEEIKALYRLSLIHASSNLGLIPRWEVFTRDLPNRSVLESFTLLKSLAPESLGEFILDLEKRLDKIEIQEQQLDLLLLAGLVSYLIEEELTPQQASWISSQKLLEAIFDLSATHLHKVLILLMLRTSTQAPELFMQNQNPSVLLKLPLACLESEGVEVSGLEIQSQVLKDQKTFVSVLESLSLLAREEGLSAQDKSRVIKELRNDLCSNAKNLLIIFNFEQSHLLQKEESFSRGLKAAAETAFATVFPLPEMKDFTKRYEEIISSFREPAALKTYAARINTLKDHRATQSLVDYTVSVLNGTYKQNRYSLEGNFHLQKITKVAPNLLYQWQISPESVYLKDWVSEEESSSLDIETWLKSKLVSDHHMQLLHVSDYLGQTDPEKRSEIEKELTRLSKEKKDELLEIEKQCVKLVKANPSAYLPILKAMEKLPLSEEFKNDVSALISRLKRNQSIEELRLIETDDPQDMLLCGTEVSSCQRVSGNPKLSKGLLGYLLHGQTRMIAIKNKVERIVARSLLRLLWDGRQPVLFLERFYTNSTDTRFEQAMIKFAKRRAEQLGCPLTSLSPGEQYERPLEAFSGPAPFEYVDAINGMAVNGAFTIRSVNKVT